jgi:hypothetical protein
VGGNDKNEFSFRGDLASLFIMVWPAAFAQGAAGLPSEARSDTLHSNWTQYLISRAGTWRGFPFGSEIR